MKPLEIAYVSSYSYASGAANNTRTNGVIRSLELAGHRVRQMGGDSDGLRPTGWMRKTIAKIPALRTLGMGSDVSSWLSGLNPTPDVVFVYGADPRFLRPARRWARSRKIPIVVEVVDWYEIRDGVNLGQKFFIGLTNLWSMPREAARCDAAVVASTALEDYFRDRGLVCLRIPAIMDTISPTHLGSQPRAGALSLIYAGTPGRRDRKTLENIDRLTDSSAMAGLNIEIDVIGVESPEEPARRNDSTVKVRYHGRVPRETVLALTSGADFTVLQRDPARRFARTGFPSKIAESLLLGTPVLSNLSSDLREFLRDEENAIVLASDSYDSLVDGVVRAAQWMDSVEPDRQKIAADSRGVFSPDAYVEALSELLGFVVEGGKK
ncbi:glycosyltransferase family 4 protein [Diaminobutyricibacter tongyongensis]|uniref:Glycosyltransferase family 4 protein n=1 Tax=Leifsonia tongyongensis TaxID=1268043 RepID=A0A6L9XVJ2_9MICO|nr:glycosyltransferase [Diaminobutyricibacter tongyongensis]NEN05451.1 glycosyltransferase family 4 protein [Diaminobutyricibacter tongyongensis]